MPHERSIFVHDYFNNLLGPELSEEAKELIKKWKEEYRQPIIKDDWTITYLKQAFDTAKRSPDSQTQCGCVLTTPTHHIIATGYNGFIRDIDDSILPNVRPEKYPWMIHAEHNAILQCAFLGKSSKDSIMYVTGEPCINCYQFMYQAGVTEIIYGNNDIKMTGTDPTYKVKVEIFKHLTHGKLKIRYINYPEIGV